MRDGKADIATLNRDITRAQEITRDEASGVSFYASTSAIEEAASGFEGIRGNVEAIERGIADGSISVPNIVRDFLASSQMGLGEFAELVNRLKQEETASDLPAEGESEALLFAPVVPVGVLAARMCLVSPACRAIIASLLIKGTLDTVYNNDKSDQPGIGHNGGPELNDEGINIKGPKDPRGMDPVSAAAIGYKGSKGFELRNAPKQHNRNSGDEIEGVMYSGHALDQMQNRGIMPSVVKNTINTGNPYPTRAGTKGFYDAINGIRVIINSDNGRVITVIRGAP